MTLPQPVYRCTPEEYLRRETDSHTRHEYYHGEVFAMSGGTFEHSRICANIIRELGNRLRGTPCGVQDSNLRVRVPRTTLYTYPDASVLCGEPQFDPLDASRQTLTNPIVIVEVLSPSTERWDRGGKFQNYQQIESLKEYVLVSSEKPLVECFRRHDGGTWIYTAAPGVEARARFNSLAIEIPLAEIYGGVEFPPPSEPASQVI